ncbi:DNA cytosine methyltransferase [Parasphingorhabdus sp. DH2-15]|uniref:DNA cytosine methyltransferase n=1 Tax=Parasphingorhabdus sp. DH2-15 TaxID=3444112 RepID=UPI003F682CCE
MDPSYRLDCFEVNAVNYGAPQLRERVLFIGNRFNRELEFPSPTHGSVESLTVDLFNDNHLEPWVTLRDAIGSMNDPGEEIMDFSPRKKKFLSLVAEGSNWRILPEELQKESMGKAYFAKGGRSGWWRRLSFDLPCPTLVTMPNHASTSLCHPVEVRALTVKEYAAIQGFPSDWAFKGTTSQKYAQIGNAVPVRLGEVAGTVIAEECATIANLSTPVTSGAIKPFRKIYIQSHVRTRKWFDGNSAKIWKDGSRDDNPSYGSAKTQRRVSRVE